MELQIVKYDKNIYYVRKKDYLPVSGASIMVHGSGKQLIGKETLKAAKTNSKCGKSCIFAK